MLTVLQLQQTTLWLLKRSGSIKISRVGNSTSHSKRQEGDTNIEDNFPKHSIGEKTKLLEQYSLKYFDVLLDVPLFAATDQSMVAITALVRVKKFCTLKLLSLLLGRMVFIHIVDGSLLKEREIHIQCGYCIFKNKSFAKFQHRL